MLPPTATSDEPDAGDAHPSAASQEDAAAAPTRLKAALRVLWRGPATVQIGMEPSRGIVLDGLTDTDRVVIEQLARGAALRPVTARERELVTLLDEAGLTVRRETDASRLTGLGPVKARFVPDAQAWSLVGGDTDGWERLAGRRRRRVLVEDRTTVIGRSRTTVALTAALDAAGLADIAAQTDPTRTADLVVLVDLDVADASRAAGLLADDVAHLSVVLRQGGVDVGPLVVPGQGACLRCVDLHRTEADPAWPRLLAQLARRRPPARTPTEESACAQLAGALAALQVLGHLDTLDDPGTERPRPAAVSTTLEVRLPDGLVVHRAWPTHPECGCHWPPGGPRAHAQVTMGR